MQGQVYDSYNVTNECTYDSVYKYLLDSYGYDANQVELTWFGVEFDATWYDRKLEAMVRKWQQAVDNNDTSENFEVRLVVSWKIELIVQCLGDRTSYGFVSLNDSISEHVPDAEGKLVHIKLDMDDSDSEGFSLGGKLHQPLGDILDHFDLSHLVKTKKVYVELIPMPGRAWSMLS
ncbi:hypothetical protein GGF42_006500 [Coemansia sp. RSA 2424]|nr:hypothetical protein GGF42_006500 [Coemansia sp. RSA 2424]